MVNKPQVIEYLHAAAAAADLRHRVIAGNIAHLDVPGYRRAQVKFESLLKKHLDTGAEFEPDDVQAKVFRPMTTPVNGQGNDVDLETEIGDLLANSGRYKAYMRMLDKIYGQMELAING